MNNIDINLFKSELRQNLTENILPYWMNKMCDPRGGFYGRRDGYDNLDAEAPKGAILHGRIVWTFSAAHRFSETQDILTMQRELLILSTLAFSTRNMAELSGA